MLRLPVADCSYEAELSTEDVGAVDTRSDRQKLRRIGVGLV